MAIQDGKYDNLLNSKAEWGMNAIPRQRVMFKDSLWEDDPLKGDLGANNKPPDRQDAQQPSTKRQSPPTLFESQFAQRRKRARVEKNETASSIDRRPNTQTGQTAKARKIDPGKSKQNGNKKAPYRTDHEKDKFKQMPSRNPAS